MSSYNEFKKELLKNPEVKAEYDALEPEFNIIQTMIDARKQQDITQEDVYAIEIRTCATSKKEVT